MSTVKIEVVSSEKTLYSGEVTMLVVPGVAGELGILPNHAPLLTNIKPGVIKLNLPDGKEDFIYVSGGILEVQPDKVTVLADVAERGDALDEARAEEARLAAEDKLQSGVTGMDYAAAQVELAQAAAQLQAIKKLRQRAGL
ncbi:F0F1 ATP synthase subunit epsilon [Candidatus Persebacteraceae bacterium Df01]|jgi:F-type H+-transporting ATPase subunit epsilon|uniref:ATP synthase epsilon chain n=1 Tax=Candidatus Doriopsillibacter californiensis TaxID=2970740 RepID=A0ABT7QKK8_9GAMM|nr:F0F1 ATP synthase subunit epsilon [Candidatus Persebacteraceae bacterium Df01]